MVVTLRAAPRTAARRAKTRDGLLPAPLLLSNGTSERSDRETRDQKVDSTECQGTVAVTQFAPHLAHPQLDCFAYSVTIKNTSLRGGCGASPVRLMRLPNRFSLMQEMVSERTDR